MPFQSEKQRRYLWANEPEIARDWTDTYGSRIEAALGGIMALAQGGRIGFMGAGIAGGGKDSADRGGLAHQKAAKDAIDKAATRSGDDAREKAIEKYSTNPYGQKTKGFLGRVGANIKDYITSGGLIGMGLRGLSSLFGGTTPSTQNLGPAGLTSAGTYGTVQDAINASRRNESPVDRGGNQYIAPQYNWDDLYAQNMMQEDGIDIDTSTGNMEDWSQRFRVDNPYRQDQGALDNQIREYVSKLYT